MKTTQNSLIFKLILSFIIICSNISAQENIAKMATASTSYISTWETITALNDGFEPASSTDYIHGAYGNWQSGVTNQWNWVQYSFNDFYYISRSDVYWWTDNNGVAIPYSCEFQYWDVSLKNWAIVRNSVGNGVEADKFNKTTFDSILTN